MPMEVHQLKYFVAVAEAGHFSRAAERCHVSQPSLSQQIIKLEGEVGQPLFDRAGRRVLLTAAGRLLLDHARLVLLTLDTAARQIKELEEGVRGRLSVGVIPTIAPYLFPAAVREFLERFPSVDLTIQEDYTSRLIAGLCEGELDVAVMVLPVAGDQLTYEVLGEDPLLLALPRGHRLARSRKVGWEEIKREAFVAVNEMHCLGEQVFSLCRGQGFEPRVTCRSSQIATVQEMVGLGQGISLLPRMACREGKAGPVVYREVAGARPSRTLVAVRHRQRHEPPAVRHFVCALNVSLRASHDEAR